MTRGSDADHRRWLDLVENDQHYLCFDDEDKMQKLQ